MKLFENRNWGLKLLALVLAIVLYHVLKSDSPENQKQSRKSTTYAHEGQRSVQPGK